MTVFFSISLIPIFITHKNTLQSLLLLNLKYTDDYRAHTSCITESERYEGKFAKKSKKRNPQEEWMDIVHCCASSESLPLHLQSHFQTMTTLDNIPRQQKKFTNFAGNSLGLRGGGTTKLVNEIWEVLKTEKDKRQIEKEKIEKVKKEQQEAAKKKKEQEQKKIVSEDDSDSDDDESEKEEDRIDPKSVQKAVKKVLKKAPNKSMKKKALRKVLLEKLGLKEKKDKKRLKKMLEDAPTYFKTDKLKVDGKIITLA